MSSVVTLSSTAMLFEGEPDPPVLYLSGRPFTCDELIPLREMGLKDSPDVSADAFVRYHLRNRYGGDPALWPDIGRRFLRI